MIFPNPSLLLNIVNLEYLSRGQDLKHHRLHKPIKNQKMESIFLLTMKKWLFLKIKNQL
jgi:hypothetical protein